MFRFIQISDLRLGSMPWLPGERGVAHAGDDGVSNPGLADVSAGLGLQEPPAGLMDGLRQDPARTLQRIVGLAREHQVDALLIPGNLFCENDCAREDLIAAFEALASLAPIPVFVAPGRLDALRPGSALSPATAALLDLGAWPSNLHVLAPGSGPRACAGHALFAIAPGAPLPLGPATAVDGAVLLAPDAILDTGPSARSEKAPEVSTESGQPGSADGWAWIAAGGSRAPHALATVEGRPLGGCPGFPLAHELPGPVGGAWLVELGGSQPAITVLSTAPRRGWILELDVTPVMRAAELDALARRALERVGCSPADLVWFRLHGTWRLPMLPRIGAAALRPLCIHAWTVAGDLVLAPPAGSTVLELQLRALMARARGPSAALGLTAIELALSAWQPVAAAAAPAAPAAPARAEGGVS